MKWFQLILKNRKRTLTVVGIVVAILVLSSTWRIASRRSQKITTFSAAPSVESLQRLSHLVSLKVQIADILEGTTKQGSKWVKGAWLIKGDALIGVDMAKATIDHLDSTNRIAVITLPPPVVMQPRVDHTRTKTYDVDRGTFTPKEFESEIRDDAMRKAQELIEFAAKAEESMTLARERAEVLLKSVYSMVDWTIEIQWNDKPIQKPDGTGQEQSADHDNNSPKQKLD